MSSIDTLIKLHRWQLDEQRRQLVDIETLADNLRAELQHLDAEAAHEESIASGSPEASMTFTGYARVLKERREKLARSIAETEDQMTKARAALADAFAEVKRYEIAAANRLLAKHRRLERIGQQQLDEVAIEGFRRKTGAV